MRVPAFILPVFLAVSLGSIHLLPTVGKTAESAVRMDLPSEFGGWQFNDIPPSKEEIGTLAPDTEFSKAVCLAGREGEYDDEGRLVPDRINLSVVLSGIDINNSIHRPERCMPAQGHRIVSSSDKVLKLDDGRSLTVKRLLSVQRIKPNQEGGETLELNCITYYFFVGHDHITNDHLGRTWIDMKDRLFQGADQRWAYVSTSMWFGKIPWIPDKMIAETEAEKKLSEFVAMFAEKQIAWDQIAR